MLIAYCCYSRILLNKIKTLSLSGIQLETLMVTQIMNRHIQIPTLTLHHQFRVVYVEVLELGGSILRIDMSNYGISALGPQLACMYPGYAV